MNVIVIACNGLNVGWLGPYGNPWIATPNLDRLAAEGVVFDNHYVANLRNRSTVLSSRATREAWWTGRLRFLGAEADPVLDSREQLPSLPERLSRGGVGTAWFSDATDLRDNGWSAPFDEIGWIRGAGYDPETPEWDPEYRGVVLDEEPGLILPDSKTFDHLDEEESAQRTALWTQRFQHAVLNRRHHRGDDDPSRTGVARTIARAEDWIRQRGSDDRSWLLWIDLHGINGPFQAPSTYRDRYLEPIAPPEPVDEESGGDDEAIDGEDSPERSFEVTPEELRAAQRIIDLPPGPIDDHLSDVEQLRLRRTIAELVTHIDDQIGRLMQSLRDLERLDDTLVIFTSDQGLPLGEHGLVRPEAAPILYEELTHTPLIIRMPGAESAGLRHQALVQPIDLMPTILQAFDLPAEPERHGNDLISLIHGRSTKFRDYACLSHDQTLAIRTPYWLLIVPTDPEQIELFAKPEDRWDQNSVLGDYIELAEHLELVLRRFVEAADEDGPLEPPLLREIARIARSH